MAGTLDQALTGTLDQNQEFDNTVPASIGTAAAGSSVTVSHRDHVHPTGAGSPASSAEGDAAATGTGPAAAMTDHRHARSTATKNLWLKAEDATLDSGTFASLGASPNQLRVVALADAATQGCTFNFAVPADWSSGVITAQPFWVPGATDGTAHTVRWTYVAKERIAGADVTAAGTSTAWTGASLARTINLLVIDTATSTTITPSASNTVFALEVQRIGADAADTYVGVVNLVGILISYTAKT